SLIALAIFTAHGFGHVVTASLGQNQGKTAAALVSNPERIAGLLLLLQLALVYFARTFVWVGEPMGKANLGSITALQKERTPAGVKECLDRWCKMLGDHH